MARIRIINAAEQNHVPVSNTSVSADIPVDGNFHEIHDDLLPVLDDSAVEYEVEQVEAAPRKARPARKRSAAKSGARGAGGAAALGGTAAPSTRSAAAKARSAKQARVGGKFAKRS